MKNCNSKVKSILISIGLVLLILQSGYGEEIYTPTTIAVIKWGSADTEFGDPALPAGEESGPQYLTVTNNGEMFILDAVKKRVLIFDTQGKYKRTTNIEIDYGLGTIETAVELRVDSKGDIYIYSQGWGFFVDKFNRDGKLIKRYLIGGPYSKAMEKKYLKYRKENVTQSLIHDVGEDVVYQGFKLISDSSDNVFLLIYKKDNNELMMNISDKLNKHEHKHALKARARNASEGYSSKRIKDDAYEIQKIGSDGSVRKKIQINLPGKYIERKHHYFASPSGEDNAGNIYVDMTERKFDETKQSWEKAKHWINKYDQNGNLIARIDLAGDAPGVTRDWNGNYYQIKWDLKKIIEGVQLIKWSAR